MIRERTIRNTVGALFLLSPAKLNVLRRIWTDSCSQIEHFIDQLCQNIMCHRDTMMNTALYYPSVKATFVDTESVHTCQILQTANMGHT